MFTLAVIRMQNFQQD